jgi:hypothetical protein
MAAISSSLFAASAQTANAPSPVASPLGGIDFASLLLAVALPAQPSLTGQAPPAATALPEELAEAGESTDAATPSAAGAVLVAGALFIPPPVPPTATTAAVATAQPIPATLPATLATTLPTPVVTAERAQATATTVLTPEVAPTPSRSEQLRLTTAPATRAAANTPGATPEPEATLPQLPAEPPADRQTAPAADRTSVQLPLPTTPPPVEDTTTAVALNRRTAVVVPQVPVIAERSQQLPALPPEIGYSLVRPELTAPAGVKQVAEVGVGVSQGQIEATVNQFTTAAANPTPTNVPRTNTGAAFEPVLATLTGTPEPTATVPTPEVVTAAGASIPQPTTPPDAERPTVEPVRGSQYFPVTLAPPNASPTVGVLPAASRFVREVSVGETAEPTRDAGQQVRADAVLPATTPVAGTETPPVTPRVNANAPSAAAQVSDAFVTHAQVLVKGGRHEFQLRLDPPELGEVQVRVLATGDRLEARLVVTDDAVKYLIESQLPELRQRLEAAGVSVPQFDVTTDSGGRATGDERWQQSQPAFAPAPKSTAPAARTPTRSTAAGGLIDVTA